MPLQTLSTHYTDPYHASRLQNKSNKSDDFYIFNDRKTDSFSNNYTNYDYSSHLNKSTSSTTNYGEIYQQQIHNNNHIAVKPTSLNCSSIKYDNTKQSRSPPINLTTNALTNFASNLQQDIVQQVLKELKLKEKDGDSKLFVVMCKFMDEIVHNINESLVNKIENIKQQNTKYLNSFDIMIKQQQQQQQQLQQNINNKFDALTNIMYTNLKDIQ
eukprot:179544_1